MRVQPYEYRETSESPTIREPGACKSPIIRKPMVSISPTIREQRGLYESNHTKTAGRQKVQPYENRGASKSPTIRILEGNHTKKTEKPLRVHPHENREATESPTIRKPGGLRESIHTNTGGLKESNHTNTGMPLRIQPYEYLGAPESPTMSISGCL